MNSSILAVRTASIPPPLHRLEVEVMEELWRSAEAPVRAVMEALNKSANPERAYTTCMTIMAASQEGRPGAAARGQDRLL